VRTTALKRIRISGTLCWLLAAVASVAWAQDAAQPQELPDSPGAVIAQRTVEEPLFEVQTTSSSAPQQSQPSQPAQSQSQSGTTQKPVGTAAAEGPATTGVAASNPAGAAIAPAKQKRVRVLFIKVGAIVGAGVAVGAVAALATASPSKPPGSH
jgi:hypothetical protein